MKLLVKGLRWISAAVFVALALWFLVRGEPVGGMACIVAAAGSAP